jgi:hypothetical protein
VEVVLFHFQHRTEALLFALECKYFVVFSDQGLAVPYSPDTCPNPGEEDEQLVARRAFSESLGTEVSEWTTDSFKGYALADLGDCLSPSFWDTPNTEKATKKVLKKGGESEFL